MSRIQWILILTLVALVLPIGRRSTWAQSDETRPAGAELIEPAYKLVVDDRIQVVVEGHDMTREYLVPANGEVSFPPIGRVKLLDKTTEQLETEIAAAFRERGQLTDPTIFVIIMAYAPRKAFLIGAITNQIALPVHTKYGILEVLSMAGASPQAGDFRNVAIIRKGQDGAYFRFSINVEDVLTGSFEKNIIVMPDDIIHIPGFQDLAQTAYVYVLGKVNRPGRYAFIPGRETLTLTKLLSLSGDFHQFANQSAVKILRKEGNRTRSIVIDFDEIIDLDVTDPVLQADDLLYVPESLF